MRRLQLFLLASATLLGITAAVSAHGPRSGWSVGFSYGFPSYRPWYPYSYRPYPLYVETYPAPVIVRPAPVVVRPSPIVIQEPATLPSSVVTNSISPVSAPWTPSADTALQQLSNPDENIRRDAVMELGRMKVDRAADSLAATLAGDRSAVVRDAAARALGLIASPRSLPALTHAAQADSDRDVRRSAQFAVEVIQSRMRP